MRVRFPILGKWKMSIVVLEYYGDEIGLSWHVFGIMLFREHEDEEAETDG